MSYAFEPNQSSTVGKPEGSWKWLAPELHVPKVNNLIGIHVGNTTSPSYVPSIAEEIMLTGMIRSWRLLRILTILTKRRMPSPVIRYNPLNLFFIPAVLVS
jgi:hypothetical protein